LAEEEKEDIGAEAAEEKDDEFQERMETRTLMIGIPMVLLAGTV